MTLRKITLFLLGSLLLPPAFCYGQVISQAQVTRYQYQPTQPTPPAFTGYVYINNSGQMVCINANGSSCLPSSGGTGTVTGVLGTANQIASDGSSTTPTLSIPSTFIAPGTISAVTSIDATKLLGNLPALSAASLTGLPLTTGVTGTLPAANGGVASVTTSGKGGMWFPTISTAFGAIAAVSSVSNNQAIAGIVAVPFNVTVTNFAYRITTGQTSGACDFGIYNTAGTLLTHTGSVACTATVTATVAASPQVTLTPGNYYYAYCSNNTAIVVAGLTATILSQTMPQASETAFFGTASGACTAGVLNAALGTVTNSATPNFPVFYVSP